MVVTNCQGLLRQGGDSAGQSECEQPCCISPPQNEALEFVPHRILPSCTSKAGILVHLRLQRGVKNKKLIRPRNLQRVAAEHNEKTAYSAMDLKDERGNRNDQTNTVLFLIFCNRGKIRRWGSTVRMRSGIRTGKVTPHACRHAVIFTWRRRRFCRQWPEPEPQQGPQCESACRRMTDRQNKTLQRKISQPECASSCLRLWL